MQNYVRIPIFSLMGLADAAQLRPYEFQTSPDSRLLVVVVPSLHDLEGQGREQALQSLTGQLYARFQDRADFLLLVANRRQVPLATAVSGYHFRVSNNVQGIGVLRFNNGAKFGGTKTLQGILYFPRWYGFWRSPLLHELAHQWANDALTTSEKGHFGFCSAGSQLGGFDSRTLKRLGPTLFQAKNLAGRPFGTAANGGNSVPYSDFELYLMGFLDAKHIRPMQCAESPVWVNFKQGIFRASRINTLTIQDIIRQRGPRLPDATSSPKTFRVLAVLVSGQQPTPAAVRAAERALVSITALGDNGDSNYSFHEATRGLGQLELLRPWRLRK